MDERIEKIRKEIEKSKTAGRRVRYSNSVKQFAVEFGNRRVAEGASLSIAAKELGLSDVTLGEWINRSKVKFRKVEVKSEPVITQQSALALVTPNGFRIEGLDLSSAVTLLRDLG